MELFKVKPVLQKQVLVSGSSENWPALSQAVHIVVDEQAVHPVIKAEQAPQPVPFGVNPTEHVRQLVVTEQVRH